MKKISLAFWIWIAVATPSTLVWPQQPQGILPAVDSALRQACDAANVAIAEGKAGYFKASSDAAHVAFAASEAAEAAYPAWTQQIADSAVADQLIKLSRASDKEDPYSMANLLILISANEAMNAAESHSNDANFRAIMLALRASTAAG